MEETAPINQIPPVRSRPISVTAELSLILGILSFCLPLLAIPAVILGFIAIARARQPLMACAGIMLGALALVLFGAMALFVIDRYNLALSHSDWGAFYCRQGEYQKAVAEFTKAIEKSPEAGTYRVRGIVHCRMSDYGSAIADFTRAIELNPDDKKSRSLRGLLYWQKGDIRNALLDWQGARRKGARPEDAYAIPDWEELLPGCKNPKGYPEARPARNAQRDKEIEKLSAALLALPTDPEFYNQRGKLYEEQNDRALALADYDKAVELYRDRASEIDPSGVDAYYNRAFLKDQAGDLDGAIRDYDKIIEIEPDPDAFLGRAEARYKKGEFKDAIADRKIAGELEKSWAGEKLPVAKANRPDTDQAEARLNSGFAFSAKQDHDNAIAEFTQAIKLRPAYTDAYIYRGNAYKETKNYRQALADYNRAVELKTDNPMAYINRAIIHLSNRDYDRAVADCTRALELKPGILHAYYYRGKALHARGEYDRALADFRIARGRESHFMPTGERESLDALIWKTEKAKGGK